MLLCPLSGSYLVLHVFLLSLSFFCPQRSCFTVVFRLFIEVLFSSCSSSDSSLAGFCKRPIFTKVFGAAFLPQGSHVLICCSQVFWLFFWNEWFGDGIASCGAGLLITVFVMNISILNKALSNTWLVYFFSKAGFLGYGHILPVSESGTKSS